MKINLLLKMLLKLATQKMMACLFAALLFCSFSLAQESSVTGKVIDETGQPLVGVNVLVVGTTAGAITDIDGKYKIKVPSAESQLQFSFVGYIPETVTVGTQTIIDVSLDPEATSLDEIVVIGYGTEKKKLNTGANVNVKGEDIQALNTNNAMDALKGISPGVSITQNSGSPGSGNKIFIRGIGTVGNYAPLYIVDGVTVGDINNLSPSDIESIDVLKDAASAAIYGSRGANGVVLVTTRKGKIGSAPVVNLNVYYGWQNVSKGPDLLNAQKYTELMVEQQENAGKDSAALKFEQQVPDWDKIASGEWAGTNWFKEIEQKNAPVQSYALNVSGGNENSIYSLGASFYGQQGILGKQANNDYQRINLRLNSEHNLLKAHGRNLLVLGENLTITNEKTPTIRTGSIYWSDVHSALVASPYLPMYADTITDPSYPYHYAIPWNTQESNPTAEMINQSKWNTNNNNKIIGNAYLELQPIKNLKIRSAFGVNNWYGSSRRWTPSYSLSDVSNKEFDEVNQRMNSGYTWVTTNTITYTFNIQNNHSFTILAGQEATRNARSLYIEGNNDSSIFNDPEYGYLSNFADIGDRYTSYTWFEGKDEYGWAMQSYFGRISYNYKEKYMATVLMRKDASSNFAKKYWWKGFPSVSAGWVISNESFMDNTRSWIDYLKLRGSWGQNGNQDLGTNGKFVYLSNISLTGANYFFGPNHAAVTGGSSPLRVPNPDVKWETSQQTDIGADINFLQNKLQFSFDWYQKDTKDWLVTPPAPSMNGTLAPFVNGGSIRNSGIETLLRWSDNVGDIRYGISGSVAYNKNEVMEVASADSIFHGPSSVLAQGTAEMYRAQTGYPVGYFWGYETDGILQNEAEAAAWLTPDGKPYFTKKVGADTVSDQVPGDVKFVDKNHDGLINDLDKVMIGNPHPKLIVGLTMNFDYKWLSISLTGNGQFGQQIAMNYRSPDNFRQNFTQYDYDNRWHGEGTSDKMPRLYRGAHRNTQYISDIYVYSGNYFRISNFTVGVDLSKLFKGMPFKETRVYAGANNLYTFTKYPGMDPEVGYSPDSWGGGIDLGLYPQSRTYMLGANITF